MPRKSARAENLPKRTYTLIPPQLRERAAVLVLDEGCTISDVADIMNVNRSALSKVVQKARKERALEPPLAAAAGDSAAVANGSVNPMDPNSARAMADAAKIGRGKAAINRHKAATSVSYEGMLCFPGPSLLTFYKYLHRTKKSMDICVESITCVEIVKAILSAKARGVRVRVITNEKERFAEGSVIQMLVDSGIAVRTHESMRHRFCLLDNMTLLHGSFSWGRTDNAEEMVVRTGGPLINRFRYQFDSLWAAYEPAPSSAAAMAGAKHPRTFVGALASAMGRESDRPGSPKRTRTLEPHELAPTLLSAALPHLPASMSNMQVAQSMAQHELTPAQLSIPPELAHVHLATLAHDHERVGDNGLGGSDDSHRLG